MTVVYLHGAQHHTPVSPAAPGVTLTVVYLPGHGLHAAASPVIVGLIQAA